ncbi:MAG: hypothetical protein P8013_10780 [Candidatus Sulfobium sp.]|jgi:nitric oxide reductase NorD protein
MNTSYVKNDGPVPLKALAEKLGAQDMIGDAETNLSGVLDETGRTVFFQLVDTLAPLSRPLALRILGSGAATLSALADAHVRAEVLIALLDMGRSKWSVVEEAYEALPSMAGAAGDTVSRWIGHGAALAEIDLDVALQYFQGSVTVLKSVGPERFETWAFLGRDMARHSWKAAKEYFRASPEVLQKVDHCDLERWARLGLYLIEKSPRVKAEYNAHSLLAAGSGAGKSKKIELAVQYFKSAPQILGRLTVHDLEEWVAKGLETADAATDKGKSFFSLQTGSSRHAVENLVKGLELRDIQYVLRSYAEALTQRKLRLRSSALFYKNLPGLSRLFSVTDGSRIFLPSRVDVFTGEDMNFKAYKLMLSHELGHLMHGTFDLGRAEISGLADCPNPPLAARIFEFLEDERIDFLMGLQYPGLERDRLQLMTAYVNGRRQSQPAPMSIIEAMGYRTVSGVTAGSDGGQKLGGLLNEALAQVCTADCTVARVYELALGICNSLDGDAECGPPAEGPERAFYRGIIDYDLVDKTREGTSRLVTDLVDRFRDKKAEISAGEVEAALDRIEESLPVEAEELFWQITDAERMHELAEQVSTVVEEMESEKRLRRTVYYDEWDMKLDDYRKDWCRVREMDMVETNARFYNETISDNYGLVSLLRRHFGLLRPDRVKRYFREERGDDLDLDAAIEAVVDRHAGRTPSDRVYIRREKNLRDVSVAFLVDMSYSTGDELPSGKRIIDVEREGLVLMAEALESIGDHWAVYGFSSHYRDKVDFFVVRDFGERFGNQVKMRFGNIKPMAQTRLGAAIRHSGWLLARQPSRIRLLILMSDGRPYDIDYGDADYAVEDTRRALWEGRRKGINSFCITVDKKSRDYLPYMYGEANYTLIDNIETLPARLPLIYKKLTT